MARTVRKYGDTVLRSRTSTSAKGRKMLREVEETRNYVESQAQKKGYVSTAGITFESLRDSFDPVSSADEADFYDEVVRQVQEAEQVQSSFPYPGDADYESVRLSLELQSRE